MSENTPDRNTVPIPMTRLYVQMRDGHLARTGHELTGWLDVSRGFAELVRTCCTDES